MNIEPSTLYKLVATVGVFSAVVAAAVTGIIQLLGGWLERRAADKRHLRDLALQTAVEKFKIEKARSIELREKGTKWIPPVFDAYIIHTMRLIEIAQDTSLTTEQMLVRLQSLKDFSRAADRAMRGHDPEVSEHNEA